MLALLSAMAPTAIVVVDALVAVPLPSTAAMAVVSLIDGVSRAPLTTTTTTLLCDAAVAGVGGVDPRYFLAGGLCAAISHGITTPIDVVKTRIQSDPEAYEGLSLIESAKLVASATGDDADADEGGTTISPVLLRGLGPTVVGYGLEGAAKFGLYESLKPAFAGLFAATAAGGGDASATGVAFVAASVVAGGAASVMLCPLERTRIKLVTNDDDDDGSSSSSSSAGGFAEGFRAVLEEEEGTTAGLFRGLPAMLSKQCPYTLGKQVTYDAACKALYHHAGGTAMISISTASATERIGVSLAAASLAAVVACLLSHPGDVVLTETYRERRPRRNSDDDSTCTTDFPSVVASIYDERGGIRGFYAGLSARLIQVGGIIVSQLLLYDGLKQGLGLPATGSS